VSRPGAAPFEGSPLARVFATVLLLAVACWPAFWYDEVYGTALFLVLLPPFMLRLPGAVAHTPRLLAGYLFVGGLAAYTMMTETLAGPDEALYFAQTSRFDSVGVFFEFISEIIRERFLVGTAVLAFPILYLPFFQFYGLASPEPIAALNALFWVFAALMTASMAAKHLRPIYPELPVGTAFALALISPSAMYFTSTFAKDTASAFLCVLVALCALQRRWVAAVLLLYLATMLRPYSIGVAGIYLMVMASPVWVLAAAAAASGMIVWYFTGFSAAALSNIGLIAGFSVVSPNPLRPENWRGFLAPMAAEGVFLGAMALVAVIGFTLSPRSREIYLRLSLGILVYAAILTLVGFENVQNRDVAYGFGTAGDNMLRKKMPLAPLVHLIAAVALHQAGSVFLPRRPQTATDPDAPRRHPRARRLPPAAARQPRNAREAEVT
jgi:hypothetical protein